MDDFAPQDKPSNSKSSRIRHESGRRYKAPESVT